MEIVSQLRVLKQAATEGLIDDAEYKLAKGKLLLLKSSATPATAPTSSTGSHVQPPEPTTTLPTTVLAALPPRLVAADENHAAAGDRNPRGAKRKGQSASEAYPYEVDYNDHFETSQEAYQDIDRTLRYIAKGLNKAPSELRIYDPYYCAGGTIRKLRNLGYQYIHNEKKDFYEELREGRIPAYDVVVTNPPYSADHKERCLQWCSASGKPWLLLLPNYVATKEYFSNAVSKGDSNSALPFFVVPQTRYDYQHPEGTGHAQSPFVSFWFIGLSCEKESLGAMLLYGTQGCRSEDHGRSPQALSLKALKEAALVPTQKRPSNKKRKKLAMKRKSG